MWNTLTAVIIIANSYRILNIGQAVFSGIHTLYEGLHIYVKSIPIPTLDYRYPQFMGTKTEAQMSRSIPKGPQLVTGGSCV